jgi:hypothetical protein
MTADQIKNIGPTDELSKQPSANLTATNDKVMGLAVGMRDGKIIITPVDLEFETDDQTHLSKAEHTLFKRSQAIIDRHRGGLAQALQSLHTIFAGRLYRENFSSFEKYCFALQGMTLPEDKLNTLKAKAAKLTSKFGQHITAAASSERQSRKESRPQ